MLLNTRCKALSHQLPLLGCTLSKGMKLDTSLDLRTHIKIKKTEAYTRKLKFKEKLAGENKTWMDSSNVKNLTAILSVRVCHFTKEDFKRDLQVYEYWSW